MLINSDWPEPRPLSWRFLSWVDWITGVSQLFGATFDAVVLYHSIGGVTGANYRWNLPVKHFHAQIKNLNERFEIVDLATLFEQSKPGQKRIAITFDDAFRNVYKNAIPILRKLGLPATIFLSPSYIGDNHADRLRGRHNMQSSASKIVMTESQIQNLATDDNFILGNHTLTHPNLKTLDDEEALQKEIETGKTIIQDRYGVTVNQFSYPYGAYDDTAASIVADTHNLAVTSRPDPVGADQDCYSIPRLDACQPAPVLIFETTDLSARLRWAARRIESNYFDLLGSMGK